MKLQVLAALALLASGCSFDFSSVPPADGPPADGTPADATSADASPQDSGADLAADVRPHEDTGPAPDQTPGPGLASCSGGEQVTCGSTSCPKYGIRAAMPQSSNGGWIGSCAGGAPASSNQALCYPMGGSQVSRYEDEQTTIKTSSAECPNPGERAIGGGCSCTGWAGVLTRNHPDGTKMWRCACTTVGVTAYVLCAQSTAPTLKGLHSAALTGSSALDSGGFSSVTCPGSEAIAGGCANTPANSSLITISEATKNGWRCKGGNSTPLAPYVLCIKPPGA